MITTVMNPDEITIITLMLKRACVIFTRLLILAVATGIDSGVGWTVWRPVIHPVSTGELCISHSSVIQTPALLLQAIAWLVCHNDL